jgi:hypothetical protein
MTRPGFAISVVARARCRHADLVVTVRAAPGLLLDAHDRRVLRGESVDGGVGEYSHGRLGVVARSGEAGMVVAALVLRLVLGGVYAGVAGELVRAREALLAAREGAAEGLLAGVRTYVAGLEHVRERGGET